MPLRCCATPAPTCRASSRRSTVTPFEERDRYVTRPGFRNFQRIAAGEVIGDDRHGEVAAPEGGMLLMPLYQRLGEDGFFVVREVEGPRGEGRAG